jgi:hypothetical protein
MSSQLERLLGSKLGFSLECRRGRNEGEASDAGAAAYSDGRASADDVAGCDLH